MMTFRAGKLNSISEKEKKNSLIIFNLSYSVYKRQLFKENKREIVAHTHRLRIGI